MTTQTSMGRRNAFTLLELMVVVAIVIILSAIAVPLISNTVFERSVYNTAVELQQDLRLVQQDSITQRIGYPTYCVALDSMHGTWTVTTGAKSATRRLPSVLTMSLVGFSSPLSFSSMGNPCNGTAASALSSDCSVLIGNASGTKQVSVTIGAVIGRISVAWTAR